MLRNDLKLNDDKTELIVLHAKHRPPPNLDNVQVASAPVSASLASPFAKNIGVGWYDNFSQANNRDM